MSSRFKVAVWSDDPSMRGLAGDLSSAGKCATVAVESLPETALLIRDNPGDVVGCIFDLRVNKQFQKNPVGLARELMQLKGEEKATPFVVVVANHDLLKHFSADAAPPIALTVLVVTPSMEASAVISDALCVISERIAQIEERMSLEQAFIEEANALVEEIEPLILSLEQNPGDAEALNTVFRNIHTIKGSSGFFDSNPIPEFLHGFEDVLSKMKSGRTPVSPASVTIMLKGLDVTRQMLDSLSRHVQWDGTLSEVVKMFEVEAPSDKVFESAHPVDAVADAPREFDEPKANSKTREAIQVPVQMLDEFMELSGEITVIRNMVNKLVRVIEKETPGNRNVSLLGELLDEMHKINSSVQGRLTELRKVPAGRILKPLPRAVRELGKALGKQIELKLDGEGLRLDTAVAQVLGESLVHLVRNAMDHGIETPAERVASGKDSKGILEVSLREDGEEVFAVVRDDGFGIDSAKIRKQLLAGGKIPEAEILGFSDVRLFSTIFEPGFSTAVQVTGISGRGVGLDMVKSSVEKLGGRIEIDSKWKVGTSFTLRLPIPKSVLIVSSLLVQAERQAFAVPQDKIVRLIRVTDALAQGMVRTVEGGVVLDFHGVLVPVVDLGSVLQLREKMPSLESNALDLASLVVIQAEGGLYACLVDAILDSEEIVMKKVGAQLEGRKAFAGATFMGDGTVGLILNVDGIAELSEVHLKFADVSKSSRVVAVNRKNDVLLVDIDVPGDFGVPMDSVYRLEDFDPDQVRNSIDRSIVVYRDQAMPLVDLSVILKTGINGRFKPEPVKMDNRERAFVLVFRTRAGQFFGCVVDRIKDFLTIEEDLLQTNRSYACVKGSIILENRVISVLDPEVVVDVATRVFDQPASVAMNDVQSDDAPVHFCKQLAIGLHPVTQRDGETEYHLAVRHQGQKVC